MSQRTIPIIVIFVSLLFTALWSPNKALSVEPGFKQYTDPSRRFILDYPATMRVSAPSANEVSIYHPRATLKIHIFVEKRPRKTVADAKTLLETFKRKLREEKKDVMILEEGKLPGLEGSQGYLICSFKNHRGIRVVQLVQYYVTQDRLLLLIISDRVEGFKNLATVIRKIHRSLRIVDPKLREKILR
jgi:hypothetical protein